MASVWPFLCLNDANALRIAGCTFLDPLYGSCGLLPMDDRVYHRRLHGWGRATPKIGTFHHDKSGYFILHLCWDYFSLQIRKEILQSHFTLMEYAYLRRRASNHSLHYLREPRRFPGDDMSPLSDSRAMDMGAALLRFNFNYGDFLRWLGGEYTNQGRDWNLLSDVIAKVRHTRLPSSEPPVNCDAVLHLIHHGAPLHGVYRGTFADVIARNLENNRRLDSVMDTVMEKFRKEEKHSYHIMFPRFLWRFIPGLFLSLISYIPPKPGRLGDEGRLVCDPSTTLSPTDCGNVNEQIPPAGEPGRYNENPAVYYGTVLRRLLKAIYNMRLDHPTEEIYFAADDISAAFRWVKYHPDIGPAFASVLCQYLVIPVGMIFGARNAPSFYMILAELRGLIASVLDVGDTRTELSDSIVLSAAPTADICQTFTPAVRDKYNTGMTDLLGPDRRFAPASFVDDQAVPGTAATILAAIRNSVVAAQLVFGQPNPEFRTPCINPRKWKVSVTFHLRYIGFDWDTRKLQLAWPTDKQEKLAVMIDQLSAAVSTQPPQYMFIAPNLLAEPLGLLRHGCYVAQFGAYMSIRLQQNLTDATRKSHSREGKHWRGSPFSLHTFDELVGIRYDAGAAEAPSMQNLPSAAQSVVNNLLSDRRNRNRGDIRSQHDKAFDSRAKHFVKWCLELNFTDKSFKTLTPGQAIPLIAAYMERVASGRTLEADRKSLRLSSKSTAMRTPMVKTVSGYMNAAHAAIQLLINKRFSIVDPAKSTGIHPLLSEILDNRRKWQQPKEKREPYTFHMFQYLYNTVRTSASRDKRAILDLTATVFDWTRLGAFTGSRANEYAQTTARRGQFSRVPASHHAAEWANQPLAFTDLDFTFYTSDSHELSHSDLAAKGQTADELHIRFRFDKSQTNFSIRKFRRSGHPFLCPIKAAISIIQRARILHCKKEREPLGVYCTSARGDYTYLTSGDIIKIMRKAVEGAYPDPAHFLRQNITRIVAHSNRVTAAVALANANMSEDEIAYRLRWSPPSVKHYLRECSIKINELTKNTIAGAIKT
ncbi:hypothetical protein MPSEU_000204000 [Mayamaea pseudoterrestris]|nr:hypothetical protein MPSEU_000204000 [Mayamaea pseudoterrestris]